MKEFIPAGKVVASLRVALNVFEINFEMNIFVIFTEPVTGISRSLITLEKLALFLCER